VYSRVLNGAERLLRVRAAVVAAQHSAGLCPLGVWLVWYGRTHGYSRGTLRRAVRGSRISRSVVRSRAGLGAEVPRRVLVCVG
jgi:hypothetical protein